MFVWTISDIIGLIGLVFTILVFGGLYLTQRYVQWRCKHDQGYGETSACDAICRGCGKNLGFIGNWRDKQKGERR